MRIIMLIILLSSTLTMAQYAESKVCHACANMDKVASSNDIVAATRLMDAFTFNADSSVSSQEARAISRLSAKFIPQDEEGFIDELYYSIYQLKPKTMKKALESLSSQEVRILSEAYNRIRRQRAEGTK